MKKVTKSVGVGIWVKIYKGEKADTVWGVTKMRVFNRPERMKIGPWGIYVSGL